MLKQQQELQIRQQQLQEWQKKQQEQKFQELQKQQEHDDTEYGDDDDDADYYDQVPTAKDINEQVRSFTTYFHTYSVYNSLLTKMV